MKKTIVEHVRVTDTGDEVPPPPPLQSVGNLKACKTGGRPLAIRNHRKSAYLFMKWEFSNRKRLAYFIG